MPHVSNNVSVGGGGSGGEDATSDEVKVFTEEGTEETEKRDSERGLDEEKTSLVNISDSDKVLPSSNFFLPQGSIFGGNPFHLAARYKGENGKLLDPATLYGNGEAFRYFIPPYPHHNGYPMGFRPNTNSLAQLMLYNQEHFAQPPPAHMGIPTMSIDPKSGMPRLSPYAFPSAHQYTHPGAVYATDFRQGSWPSAGLYPISTSNFPPMPYSPGPGFPPNFAKYSPPILSPVTPASPYAAGMSPAFGAANSLKGEYMYPDLKTSPHFPIDPHHPLHAAAAFGLAAAHHSPHHQQLLHHHPNPYAHPHSVSAGGGHSAHHPNPFFMGPPLHPPTNGYGGGPGLHHPINQLTAHSKSLHNSTTSNGAGADKSGTIATASSSTSKNSACGAPTSVSCNSSGNANSNHDGGTNANAMGALTKPSKKKKASSSSHHGNSSSGGGSGQNAVVPHIKKPLNAFMLFMKDQRSKVMEECTLKESSAINQLLGRKWHGLTREEQAKYYEMARKERQIHMQLYPGWTARDNYTSHNCIKKRKKKREKTIDPIDINDLSASKKCRARYGIEQQNNWCKPCRRKKKCIKFIDDSDSNNNDIDYDDEDNNSQHSSSSINNNYNNNNNNNSIPSPATATFISTAAPYTQIELASRSNLTTSDMTTNTLLTPSITTNPTMAISCTHSIAASSPLASSSSTSKSLSTTAKTSAPSEEESGKSCPKPSSHHKTKSGGGSRDCDCCHNSHHHHHHHGYRTGGGPTKGCRKNVTALMPPLPLNPYYFGPHHPHPYFFAPPPPSAPLHAPRRHETSSPYFTFTNEREEELLEGGDGGRARAECCYHAIVEDYDGGSPLSPLSLSPPPGEKLAEDGEVESSNNATTDCQAPATSEMSLHAPPPLKMHPAARNSSSQQAGGSANSQGGGKTGKSGGKMFLSPHHFLSLGSPEAAALGYNFYNQAMQYSPFVPNPFHPAAHQQGAEKLLKTQLKKQHREHKHHKEDRPNERCTNCNPEGVSSNDSAAPKQQQTQTGKKCRCRSSVMMVGELGSHNPYADFYHHQAKRVTPPMPSPFPPPDYYFYNYMYNNYHHHHGKSYGAKSSHAVGSDSEALDSGSNVYVFDDDTDEENESVVEGKVNNSQGTDVTANNNGTTSKKYTVSKHSHNNGSSHKFTVPRKKLKTEGVKMLNLGKSQGVDGISSPRITSNTNGSGTLGEENVAVPSPLAPPDSSSDLPLHKVLVKPPQDCSCSSQESRKQQTTTGEELGVGGDSVVQNESYACGKCRVKKAHPAPNPSSGDGVTEMNLLQDDDNLHYYHYEGGDTDQLVIPPEDDLEEEDTNASAKPQHPKTNDRQSTHNADNRMDQNCKQNEPINNAMTSQLSSQRMEYNSCSHSEKPSLVTSSPLKLKTT